jgi:hypothetical protein
LGGAARLIAFIREAFDAEQVERLAATGDRIGHAEPQIGDLLVMPGGSGSIPLRTTRRFLRKPLPHADGDGTDGPCKRGREATRQQGFNANARGSELIHANGPE